MVRKRQQRHEFWWFGWVCLIYTIECCQRFGQYILYSIISFNFNDSFSKSGKSLFHNDLSLTRENKQNAEIPHKLRKLIPFHFLVLPGEHRETDLCCREHDHCPTYILPFQRRFGILNLYPSHLSLCSCEMKLYNCLWNVTSHVAVAVGRMYFNVLRVPCFHLVEKKVCKERSFDWWKFKYVCKKYGVEVKGQTFMPKRFHKQLQVQPSNWNATANGTMT